MNRAGLRKLLIHHEMNPVNQVIVNRNEIEITD